MLPIQSAQQSALSCREGRHLFTNILQQLVVVWPRGKSVELACTLLELCIEDMPIALENIDQLRFDLGEDIDPFDIRRQQQRSRRGDAKLGFVVENLKLIDGAITRFICDQMTVLAKNIYPVDTLIQCITLVSEYTDLPL